MQTLKQQVFDANMDLPRYGLVTFTWGNVSAIDRERGLVAIKPSGVAYETMKADDMVVVDLEGKVVEGRYRPSSDTATHLALYRRYPSLGGVVHTHSTHATAWAQAGLAIPALGTTHADYFFGDIPCTRALSAQEVAEAYELNTGRVIIETLGDVEPLHTPGIVVYQHGPFAWGKDAHDAVHNAVVMEEVARMAWIARGINPQLKPIDSWLMDKHFMRKHGPDAYYGQKRKTCSGAFIFMMNQPVCSGAIFSFADKPTAYSAYRSASARRLPRRRKTSRRHRIPPTARPHLRWPVAAQRRSSG